MKSWHVLRSEAHGNGCRNVPDSDVHPRVTPLYGEQPWMGAPKRISPFSEWSTMIIVPETQLLSSMHLCTSSLKWNCLQLLVSILGFFILAIPSLHGDGLFVFCFKCSAVVFEVLRKNGWEMII